MRKLLRLGELHGRRQESSKGRIIKSRQIPEVRRVKAAYCLGGGAALNSAEANFANANQALLHRTDLYVDGVIITNTPATPDDFFRLVETANCDIRNLTFITTPKAYLKLVQICDRLA